MRILLVLLALGSSSAYAQTVVLACGSPWGASENCLGCSGLKWSAPDANDYVKADGVAYWTKLGTLASSARVSIATGKAEGSTATCATITGTKTAGELLGASPPAEPPVVVTGEATISWTVPTQCEDGSHVGNCAITGYRIEYGPNFSNSVSVAANVTTYKFTGLSAGTYQGRLITISGSIQSAPGNVFTFEVSASQTCGAKPADQTQAVACPTGTTGSWSQTRTYNSAAYPSCWVASAWTPTSAPTGACTPVAAERWVVTSSRALYEAVLPTSGSTLVRGNQDGTAAANTVCGDQVFTVGSSSYRDIPSSGQVLTSPTYAGRRHVAVCTKQ